MYTRIFDELSDGDEDARKVALECFRWMLYAKQPPSLEILRVAVALLESPHTAEDLKVCLPSGEYIVEECRNLLQLGKFRDLAFIDPVHFSFLEYLENLPIDKLQGNFWIPLTDKHDAESVLACRCIQWLLLALPEELSPNNIDDVHWHLSYPMEYFDKHAISASKGTTTPSANLLVSVDQLLNADVGKLNSLVECRMWQTHGLQDIDEALSRDYLLWMSDLYLIPGLSSRWIELEIPKYALHFAVWFRPGDLQRLISNDRCVDELNYHQRTPLDCASAKGCLASVDTLLRAGARLEANSWRTSPLGLAIQNDHVELAKMLLEAKANTCISPDLEDHSPLMMATSLKMVQLLCEVYDFDVHATDRMGRSVLGYYVGDEEPDRHITATEATRILEYLISQGADPYAKSKAGMSLLDYAACRADGDKPLKFLLQSYPKLIEKEAHEWTSLHWACRQGNSQAAKILLEHGSQIKTVTTLQPPQSWSPYQILIHNREDLRSFDESTTYALGRLEKIGLGAGQSPGAQIEYGSLEIAETRGQSSCFLCGNSVHVCDDVLLLFFFQGYDY
jgi:ankyrin repeat protein